MAVNAEATGKTYPPFEYEVGKEKIREYAHAVGEDNPIYFDRAAATEAGFRDVAAPPMFAVVYSAGSFAPALFDPEVGINFAMMVHGSQEFEWGEPVCSGDVISTVTSVKDISERGGMGFYVFETVSTNQDGQEVVRGTWTNIVRGRVVKVELKVTPDKYLPHRYAGASGDFNPIHIDVDFAKQVGLPSNILHGLYTMAQVARANVNAAGGDPRSLKRLSVQFRGMGFPEQEITVTGKVKEEREGRVVVATEAAQAGKRIIRNAEAELAQPPQ